MQSTAPSTPPPARLTLTTTSLLAAFASVPDPRCCRGKRFALPAILTLAVTAILSNHLSVLAIAEWGRAQRREVLHALGFADGVTPHQTTMQRLFRKLDATALAAALTSYFDPPDRAQARPRASQGVAIDGKAHRTRLAFASANGCPVQMLSAFCHEAGVVLTQSAIASHTDKAEAELTVAPQVVARLDWRGRVLTGDALYCQRALCQQVVGAGGDYLLLVKENQPMLYQDLAVLFTSPLAQAAQTHTVEKGHGRLDLRCLTASTDLTGYSDWPALAQVFQLTRTWQQRGQTKQVVQYGITSLPVHLGTPARLLALRRGHWGIENGLHYVKDVTLGEDRSAIRLGAGPTIMAMLRDTAISLLHQAGWRTIAARLRYHSLHPEAALALLGITVLQNA